MCYQSEIQFDLIEEIEKKNIKLTITMDIHDLEDINNKTKRKDS